ncbi:MAG TPA: NAD(P)-dependent oxidoreductase [Acidimicrobiales bacterium]|nr:NAD(P)-dependent oxidoreductase [Acidimicrobiales bacterium]
MARRVLVAGGSGFLGRNLLLAAPGDWSVVTTFHRQVDLPAFLDAHGSREVRALACDLADTSKVERLAQTVGRAFDVCLFLSANTSVPLSVDDPRADLVANAVTLLNTLASFEIGHLVFLSSGAVYDGKRGAVGPSTRVSPTLPYAVSKLAAERYVEQASEVGRIGSHAVVRFFGAYGPFEPPRKIFTRLAVELGLERRTRFRLYGDGTNLVDAMYVDDAVRALSSVARDEGRRTVVDLAAGSPMTVAGLVDRAARCFLDRPVEIERKGVAHEAIRFRADPTPFRDLYGFAPVVPMDEGLLRLRDHLAAHRLRPSA